MRRTIHFLATLCLCGCAFGQQSTDAALNQFNIQTFASNAVAERKQEIAKDEDLTIYNISSYQYTLTPAPDREYKHYQVIRLDGLNNAELVIGLITGYLERETRFIQISATERDAFVRQMLNSKKDFVFVHPTEKEYFIAPDGTFRYVDGRELVGGKKVKTYLEKGKPVTVSTFYFALKEKGLIQPEITLRTFISLTLHEKIKLLNMDIYAAEAQL